MNTTIVLTERQSRNINLLKGLSIVLVIFIHADLRSMISKYMKLTPVIDAYFETLTRILVDNAVLMFYFISGFLFFFRKNTYKSKFISRFKTLVIPFIFWCFIGFLIPFIIQRILGLEHLYSGNKLKLLKDFAVTDYLRIFWDIRDGAPILSTLWFLRDLIVFVALTPLIGWLTKKLRCGFPVILFLVYFFFPWSIPGFATNGFCWFALGAYLSLRRVNCWESIEKINTALTITLWGILTVLAIFTYVSDFYHDDYMRVYRIVHFIMIYHLIFRLSEKHELKLLFKIAAVSFFIYVFHEPWMGYIAQVGMKILHPQGGWIFIAPLFLVLFTIGFSYTACGFCKKTAPRFLNIITGSRSK